MGQDLFSNCRTKQYLILQVQTRYAQTATSLKSLKTRRWVILTKTHKKSWIQPTSLTQTTSKMEMRKFWITQPKASGQSLPQLLTRLTRTSKLNSILKYTKSWQERSRRMLIMLILFDKCPWWDHTSTKAMKMMKLPKRESKV